METILRESPLVVRRRKADHPPVGHEPADKKKTGIPARVDIKVKIGHPQAEGRLSSSPGRRPSIVIPRPKAVRGSCSNLLKRQGSPNPALQG
jgi:hypothetical protein